MLKHIEAVYNSRTGTTELVEVDLCATCPKVVSENCKVKQDFEKEGTVDESRNAVLAGIGIYACDAVLAVAEKIAKEVPDDKKLKHSLWDQRRKARGTIGGTI